MKTTIAEFSENSSIPKRVLLYLNREGLIQDPLCQEDRLGLQFLEKIWGKVEVLRPQLTRLSRKARLSFVTTAGLPSKWERYAFTRFRNQKQGSSLTMRTLVEEIESTFGFSLSSQQVKALGKIRNRVQVARHRQKKSKPKKDGHLLPSGNE